MQLHAGSCLLICNFICREPAVQSVQPARCIASPLDAGNTAASHALLLLLAPPMLPLLLPKTPLLLLLLHHIQRQAAQVTLPAEKAGDLLSGMSSGSPVLGLRPLRAALTRCSKVPKPGSVTFSPAEPQTTPNW